MIAEELTYRRASDADIPQIVDLFRAAFDKELDPEQWRWQVGENPFAPPVVWLAMAPDGRAAGHYSLIRVPLWREGQRALGAFSVMSMVHPEFQRRGILKRLYALADGEFDRLTSGRGAYMSFVNQNSFPVYTQTFGWKELDAPLPVYFRILDPEKVVSRYVGPRALRKLVAAAARPIAAAVFARRRSAVPVRTVNRFEQGADAVWDRLRSAVEIATDRRSDYLNWRYVTSPREYVIHAAGELDRRVAYVVSRLDEKFGQKLGYIMDVLAASGDEDHALAALQGACQHLQENGCGMVTALASQPPLIRASLRAAGFRRLPRALMPHPMHFISRDLAPAEWKTSLHHASNWYMSWSDHDVA
jgi:GNAT superfamily N-acetyltransferase